MQNAKVAIVDTKVVGEVVSIAAEIEHYCVNIARQTVFVHVVVGAVHNQSDAVVDVCFARVRADLIVMASEKKSNAILVVASKRIVANQVSIAETKF